MKYNKIGVFLSACPVAEPAFEAAARAVGAFIGRTGRQLVYGGSKSGLMETLAQAVKAEGGLVVGVVPEIVFEQKRVSACNDTVIRTHNMADRKQTMIEQSDVLVALPGGVGTIDEVFTALSMASIGYKVPRVVLYNVDGCWDDLLAMLHRMGTRSLLRDTVDDMLTVVTSEQQLEALLEAGGPEPVARRHYL
ncbi:MAG: TIGR00730 family Rossman fold protein [Alloprevotella sp.]|nr:TIGR00730 family Rossman fold protein [Alloprevotella sp.]